MELASKKGLNIQQRILSWILGLCVCFGPPYLAFVYSKNWKIILFFIAVCMIDITVSILITLNPFPPWPKSPMVKASAHAVTAVTAATIIFMVVLPMMLSLLEMCAN